MCCLKLYRTRIYQLNLMSKFIIKNSINFMFIKLPPASTTWIHFDLASNFFIKNPLNTLTLPCNFYQFFYNHFSILDKYTSWWTSKGVCFYYIEFQKPMRNYYKLRTIFGAVWLFVPCYKLSKYFGMATPTLQLFYLSIRFQHVRFQCVFTMFFDPMESGIFSTLFNDFLESTTI